MGKGNGFGPVRLPWHAPYRGGGSYAKRCCRSCHQAKVLDYLDTVEKAKSKEIAKAISEEKSAVDLAVKELAFEDKVEYLYITTTFVALKGKVAPPE